MQRNLIDLSAMETVLYITDLHVGSHVGEFAGVVDRAAAHRWRVIEVELERRTRSLAEMPCSRRLAEKRFLAATGKSILEEIQSVRLAKVFELLKSDVPIGHIAARCGMRSDSYLKRFFKARTGQTLRDWRRTH